MKKKKGRGKRTSTCIHNQDDVVGAGSEALQKNHERKNWILAGGGHELQGDAEGEEQSPKYRKQEVSDQYC